MCAHRSIPSYFWVVFLFVQWPDAAVQHSFMVVGWVSQLIAAVQVQAAAFNKPHVALQWLLVEHCQGANWGSTRPDLVHRC
jgi:hypothetical protein